MSRPQQAPPSRTLFVRNIEPSTTEAELMNLFQSFGTVRKVASNLILSRHMAFVTFYDLRHAEVRFGFAPFFFFLLLSLSFLLCPLSRGFRRLWRATAR